MPNLTYEGASALLAGMTDGMLLRLVVADSSYVSGGSYADQPVSWSSTGPSSGYLTAVSDIDFAGMPVCTIAAWEIWPADLSYAWWKGMLEEATGTAIAADDTIENVNGYSDGAMVVFNAATAGFDVWTAYFVVNAVADTFQISATLGGSPIDITADAAVTWGTAYTLAAADDVSIPASSIYVDLR